MMKRILKSAICFFVCLSISVACFAQFADAFSKMISTPSATYSQVAYFAAVESRLIPESYTEQQAVAVIEEKYPNIQKKVKTKDEISVEDFSYICTTIWNIKTSLFYMIFNNPHYALRELKARGYFDSNLPPNSKVSGRIVLLIIADISEKFGEQ